MGQVSWSSLRLPLELLAPASAIAVLASGTIAPFHRVVQLFNDGPVMRIKAHTHNGTIGIVPIARCVRCAAVTTIAYHNRLSPLRRPTIQATAQKAMSASAGKRQCSIIGCLFPLMLGLLISGIDNDLVRVGMPDEYQEMTVTVTAFPFLRARWKDFDELQDVRHAVSVFARTVSDPDLLMGDHPRSVCYRHISAPPPGCHPWDTAKTANVGPPRTRQRDKLGSTRLSEIACLPYKVQVIPFGVYHSGSQSQM